MKPLITHDSYAVLGKAESIDATHTLLAFKYYRYRYEQIAVWVCS